MPARSDLRDPRRLVGLRIREIRLLLGYTQDRFRKVLNVSQPHLSDIERGLSYPGDGPLLRLRQLGFSPSWIESGIGEMRLEEDEPAEAVADKPSTWQRLPILGRVPAGFPGPSPVELSPEGYFPMPWGLVNDDNAFCLKVVGDSMAGVIESGDLAIVSPRLRGQAKDGDLVVVRIEPNETYVKRYMRTERGAVLMSANPRYPAIVVSDDRTVEVIGKVIYTIHCHK